MKEDDERMKKVESAVVFIFITADHKEHEPWDRSFINLSFLTVPRIDSSNQPLTGSRPTN